MKMIERRLLPASSVEFEVCSYDDAYGQVGKVKLQLCSFYACDYKESSDEP